MWAQQRSNDCRWFNDHCGMSNNVDVVLSSSRQLRSSTDSRTRCLSFYRTLIVRSESSRVRFRSAVDDCVRFSIHYHFMRRVVPSSSLSSSLASSQLNPLLLILDWNPPMGGSPNAKGDPTAWFLNQKPANTTPTTSACQRAKYPQQSWFRSRRALRKSSTDKRTRSVKKINRFQQHSHAFQWNIAGKRCTPFYFTCVTLLLFLSNGELLVNALYLRYLPCRGRNAHPSQSKQCGCVCVCALHAHWLFSLRLTTGCWIVWLE